jgi:hypothetical protein
MLNPSFQPEPMHLTTAAVANAKPSSPSTNKNQLTKNRFTIMKRVFDPQRCRSCHQRQCATKTKKCH